MILRNKIFSEVIQLILFLLQVTGTKECDYNGQLYNDGERIDLPEDPCQVCYCKGGDVMCTSITCYHRDDCEPKHVPGQCCPKYEDCPIRDMEASNTDEKNVHTRSPNKTMISNPKKEIQPWLLTKSVLQTSSSLAIPKLGETTTDSGNIVIVSDWLVEQKTTEDFKTKQTEDPVLYNHQDQLSTTQSPKLTQPIVNDSRFEIKSETVRPTPIEEVVFTRIDLPKRVEEEIVDFQTTTASDEFEKSYSVLAKLSETQESKITQKNLTQTQLSNSSPNISEVKSTALNKIEKGNSTFNTSLNNTKKNEIMRTTGSITDKNSSTQAKEETEIIKPIKYNTMIKTQTPELFKEEAISNGSKNKLIKNETKLQNQPPSSKTSDDKDSKPEEVTLEHLFGFDISDESTKQIPKEKHNSDDLSTIFNDKNGTIDTTDPTKVETVFTQGNKNNCENITFTQKSETIRVHKINQTANNVLSNIQGANLYGVQITATDNSEENITTFTPEVSTNKFLLQSGKFVLETDTGDDETTYLPETTTEFGIPAMPDMTTLNQLTNETKDKLSNVIVLNQDEKPQYIETDQTTVGSSGSDTPVTTESSQSNNQEFMPERKVMFNEGNSYDDKGQETIINRHITKFNDNIYSTLTTNDFEETTKYKLSEIEIILDEPNDKIILDKSNSQESIEQDGVILNLDFDEGSSENKEVMMNHPPVLELNSHVPFLQIGGNGNSESSDIEYSQTTLITKPDYLNSFKKIKIHEEKYTTKLTDEYTTTPPLATLNKTLSLAPLAETSNRKNNSTRKVNNEKAEEITIPTMAVVPLTPGDLKTIAEYLISEKIKLVTNETNTTFSPNQWLKGNLTSENNIASILSAANVSIGLMNQTNIGRMMGTIKISNQSKRLDKYEKESQYKSKSNILHNKYTVTSKTDYLHDKSSEDQEHIKTTSSTPYKTNDRQIIDRNLSSGATTDVILKTREPLDEIFTENEFKNIKSMKSDEGITNNNEIARLQKNNSDAFFENKQDLVKLDLRTNDEEKKHPHTDSSQNKTLSIGDINENYTSANSKTEKLIVTVKKVKNNEKPEVISRFTDTDEKTYEYYHTTENIDTTSPKIPYNTSVERLSTS